MKGVSICITAYNAQDYIKECLDSVASQTWFENHDNWEIIVGVDGCQKTLDRLKEIMPRYKNLRVLMMDSNKGTYITSNTIMSQARYDTLFRFDSDDIMRKNLVYIVMNRIGKFRVLRYYLKNFGLDSSVRVAYGSMCIDKSVFMKYGGFRPWICAADSEFYKRMSCVEPVVQIKNVLMLRRVHGSSLTQSPGTGYKSELRDYYVSLLKEMDIRKPEDAVIEMETNTFKEII